MIGGEIKIKTALLGEKPAPHRKEKYDPYGTGCHCGSCKGVTPHSRYRPRGRTYREQILRSLEVDDFCVDITEGEEYTIIKYSKMV